MSKNIQKNRKLLIVSDTGMYNNDETFRAFGPVVKEVEYLLKEFDRITWIGFERLDQKNNKSYINIENDRLECILLPRIGGKDLFNKLKIVSFYPIMLVTILRLLYKHSYVHVRAPSHPAVVAMLLSYFFTKKNFWFKYAGSWVDKASKYYEIQRRILKMLGNNSKITVNGDWRNSNNNILAFENPCLDTNDREKGKEIVKSTKINGKINFCFVGALNKHKGVDIILQAFSEFSKDSDIGSLHFVGGSDKIDSFKKRAEKLNIVTKFHGFLDKNSIIEIYQFCHFIILPSKSEGFPKVIGEAMNYGCIPIVSNVSCINQYLRDKLNGFLIEPNESQKLHEIIEDVLLMKNEKFKRIIEENYSMSEKFTYDYYIVRMKRLIFSNL